MMLETRECELRAGTTLVPFQIRRQFQEAITVIFRHAKDDVAIIAQPPAESASAVAVVVNNTVSSMGFSACLANLWLRASREYFSIFLGAQMPHSSRCVAFFFKSGKIRFASLFDYFRVSRAPRCAPRSFRCPDFLGIIKPICLGLS